MFSGVSEPEGSTDAVETITRVLAKMGATVRTRGMMYKAVDKSVIMYRSESWVVTGEMVKLLEGFHHWSSRRIMGTTDIRGEGGEWEYPPAAAAMEVAGIKPIIEKIRRRQATIEEKVV